MKAINEEIKKVKKILEVLEFSTADVEIQLEKLEHLIMADVVKEVLTEKKYISENGTFNQDEIASFLQENYTENEIRVLMKKVFEDVAAEYFSKILENVSKEKMQLIEKIMS